MLQNTVNSGLVRLELARRLRFWLGRLRPAGRDDCDCGGCGCSSCLPVRQLKMRLRLSHRLRRKLRRMLSAAARLHGDGCWSVTAAALWWLLLRDSDCAHAARCARTPCIVPTARIALQSHRLLAALTLPLSLLALPVRSDRAAWCLLALLAAVLALLLTSLTLAASLILPLSLSAPARCARTAARCARTTSYVALLMTTQLSQTAPAL